MFMSRSGIHIYISMYAQIYKRALTRQRILHLEEVGQLFPSLEDLVFLHGGLLLNFRERVASSKDELVTHISDVLLQAVSLYVCARIQFKLYLLCLCTIRHSTCIHVHTYVRTSGSGYLGHLGHPGLGLTRFMRFKSTFSDYSLG